MTDKKEREAELKSNQIADKEALEKVKKIMEDPNTTVKEELGIAEKRRRDPWRQVEL